MLVAVLIAAATPFPAQAEAAAPARELLVMIDMPAPHYGPASDYGGTYGGSDIRAALRKRGREIARTHGLELVSEWPMPLLNVDCLVMAAPADAQIEALTAAIGKEKSVAWSQPMNSFGTQASSYDDPLYPAQPTATLWHLSELHRNASGKGASVAVIDTRVDGGHPDLKGRLAFAGDYVVGRPGGAEQHGTAVAGIIAAQADNGIGIVGIAPDAHLLALRGCWQEAADGRSACDTISLAKAMDVAIAKRAGIINLSLSGPYDLLLSRLIDIGLTRGSYVVAAFDPHARMGGFPASHPGVIAVAAEGTASVPASVYAAPGQAIPTTEPGGRWYLVDGSSFAAAEVSGLLALASERDRFEGRARLVASGPHGGRVDAVATLAAAQRCDTCTR